MHIEKVKISKVHSNRGQVSGLPKNPRVIRDSRFASLVKSLKEDPEMLQIREVVAYDNNGELVVIMGNQRFRALQELGVKEIEIKILPQNTPLDKLRRYVAKDNFSFGDYDFKALEEDWDTEELEDWGMEWPEVGGSRRKEEEEEKEKDLSEAESESMDFYSMMLGDRLYNSDNKYDIPLLLLEQQPENGVLLPFSPWGADSRQRKGVATYHFYVEDYRFEAIWKNPLIVLEGGTQAIVEPNLSLFDTTPIAYGLQQIYKKRWIARYYQECGIKVYADLNVARKFYEYNRMGIPKGYNAFATRGYADRIEYLLEEIQIAKEISGKDHPNMLVYGGGAKVEQIAKENGVIYIEQFMQNKER